MRATVWCSLLVLLFAVETPASWQEVAPAVSYRRYVSTSRDVHLGRIDLEAEGSHLDVLATPETDRNTTVSQFATRRDAIVAVNADFYDTSRVPVGLAVGHAGVTVGSWLSGAWATASQEPRAQSPRAFSNPPARSNDSATYTSPRW